ncbi:MAG: fatty acid desaturase family protein [Pseudomonadota bacterium]
MDQRQFIAALPQDVRRDLNRLSDGPGLRQAAGHLGALAVLGGLIAAQVLGWPLLLLPQGIVLVFLFTALHETIHRTAFASRRLNDGMARLCGVLLLLPPEWFRYFHFAHHRHTQDPERDPELAEPKPGSWGGYLWHVCGLPVWWGQIEVLVRNAAGRCNDPYVPPAAAGRVRAEARWMLGGYAGALAVSVMTGSALLLWVWVVPALLGQPFLRLYLLAEHGRCAFAANMFENTRTTFTNRLVRWLAWNMPYHAEHHAVPTVPFHKLPALHRLTQPHLQVTAPGYRAFSRAFARGLSG